MGRAIRSVLWITCAAAFALVESIPAGMALAAEVRLDHKGMGLLAEAALAPGKTWKDGAILLVHGTMAHGRMDAMAHQQKALLEQGRSSLSITLSLGVPDRRGNADCAKPQTHRHQDAAGEIAAWVGWLKGQGAADVTVFGHSRGGNQVARYALAGVDPAVRRIVLLAPTTASVATVAGYRDAPAGELAKRAVEAERLVAAGRGGEMMRGVRFLSCPQAAASAEAFLSYYRDDGKMDTPALLGDIRLPALVIAGTLDTVVPDLPARMKGTVGGRVKLEVIDGADHFFRDLIADEVAEIVVKFAGG
ncbi:MAG: alpha/beta fold hydrolase [Rhodospirillales bacterium]|nr:alpha/beta fold hydrolase [Rhodospirillales bacterium]